MDSKRSIVQNTISIVAILIVLMGTAYSFFNYSRIGGANQLIVGKIYLNYETTNSLSLQGAEPRSNLDPTKYIEFTVRGLNEYKESDIWYAIDILHGDVPTGKTEQNRIRDNLLRFTLTKKIDNGEEETIIENKGYGSIDELRIYIERIAKETSIEATHTYKLYVWISDTINVGNTENADYSISEWNNLFGSIKVRVIGDFVEKEIENGIKVSFNSNGGESVSAIYYNVGETYGTLPIPTREGYRFIGWSKTGSISDAVTSLDTVTISTANVVFEKDEVTEFTGSGDSYINTGVSLFSSSNLHRNFYLTFTIVDKSKMTSWSPFVSSHYDRNSKGFIFQTNDSGDNNRFTLQTNKNESGSNSGNNSENHKDTAFSWENVSQVDILRIDDVIYYALDGGTPVSVMDYTGFNASFDTPVAFGADYIKTSPPPRKYSKLTLSNMLIAFLPNEATENNYLQYMEGSNEIVLNALWEKDMINTFPEFITSKKENIKQVYFKKLNETDLTRYNNTSNDLKRDIATEGSVKAWLEQDNSDNLYTLYIESETPTYLTTGYRLFEGFSSLNHISFTNNNTSSVTNMNEMFKGCSSLASLDVSGFNTSSVTNMSNMFNGCSNLTSLNISNFVTSSVTNMDGMFNGCSSLTSLNISNFVTSAVTNMSDMFNGCSGLTSLNISNFVTSAVTNMSNMFKGCSGLTSLNISNFTTNLVNNMNSMFKGCSSLTSLDVSHFNTSVATNFGNMFNGCSNLTSLDVGNFVTSSVTNMGSMFCGCSNLTSLNVGNFVTSSVTNMNEMFKGCSSLTSLNISNFVTSLVTSMDGMFNGCSSLTSLNISNFVTSAVTGMSAMFKGCSSLTSLDVSGFNTSSVTNMNNMFNGCRSLTSLDLRGFSTNNVNEIYGLSGVFSGCNSLTVIYTSTSWVVNSGIDSTNMFNGCSSLVGHAPNTTYSYNSSKINGSMALVATDNQEGYFTDISLKPSA